MSDPPPKAPLRLPVMPPHPARWVIRLLVGAGVAFAFSSVTALSSRIDVSSLITTLALFGSGAAYIAIGLNARRTAPGMQLVAAAQNQVALGHLDVAEALLDQAEKLRGATSVHRAAHVARGAIALRRGDLETARKEADLALSTGNNIIGRRAAWMHHLEARSQRAFANAAMGNAASARADIAVMTELMERDLPATAGSNAVASTVFGSSPSVSLGGVPTFSGPLARAMLAEAILLAREGDKAALRDHLLRHGDLLSEGTTPSERALVRGFERMLSAPTSTPYRKVNDEAPRAESEDADWVERVLPEVAPFVREATIGASPVDDSANQHVAPKTPKVPFDWGPFKRIGGMVGGWAVLMAVIGYLWVIPLGKSGHTPSTSALLTATALPVVFILAMFALAVSQGRTAAKRRKALGRTVIRIASHGTRASSDDVAELTRLAQSKEALVRAQAYLALAQLANHQGDFVKARENAGLGLIPFRHNYLRAAGFEALLPGLMTARAFANAALGQTEDAIAEVEGITEDIATRARSVFSVKVLALANADRLDEARAFVREMPIDGPLDSTIETLTRVLRATDRSLNLGMAETLCLRDDLRAPSLLRNWLQTAAPTALAAFDNLDAGEPSNEPNRVRIRKDDHEKAAIEGGSASTLSTADVESQALLELAQHEEDAALDEPRRRVERDNH